MWGTTNPVDIPSDLRLEVYELYRRDLVGPEIGGYWLGPKDVSSYVLYITDAGRELADLMNLEEIPSEDLDPVLDALEWS
jgi:hypothetical protein